jgi:hypothetical protein
VSDNCDDVIPKFLMPLRITQLFTRWS